jgi:hypothetical protein
LRVNGKLIVRNSIVRNLKTTAIRPQCRYFTGLSGGFKVPPKRWIVEERTIDRAALDALGYVLPAILSTRSHGRAECE